MAQSYLKRVSRPIWQRMILNKFRAKDNNKNWVFLINNNLEGRAGASMLNKWKEELNAKFKKKDGPPNASDTVSNQSAPQNNNQ